MYPDYHYPYYNITVCRSTGNPQTKPLDLGERSACNKNAAPANAGNPVPVSVPVPLPWHTPAPAGKTKPLCGIFEQRKDCPEQAGNRGSHQEARRGIIPEKTGNGIQYPHADSCPIYVRNE